MIKTQIKKPALKSIDIVILCGGFGRRLKGIIKDCPKPMAEVDGRPFLQILIDYFSNFGSTRFILCTGYKGETIKAYFQNKNIEKEIFISQEEEPLGTGGAILHAIPLITSDPFFVINGDSFCKININDFFHFHFKKKALVTMALVSVENVEQYGLVNVDNKGRIIKFEEKKGPRKNGWVNAGVYLMNKDVFTSKINIPTVFSLEYDFFPKLIGKKLFGMKLDCQYFIDIGIPNSFFKAKDIIRNAFQEEYYSKS